MASPQPRSSTAAAPELPLVDFGTIGRQRAKA